MTGGSGYASFNWNLVPTIQPGQLVSATATDPAGNTSEFSQRTVFSLVPSSGPPSGGTPINLTGTNFIVGASVTIGDDPAPDVVVLSSGTLTALAPALPAGSVSDITVTNADSTNGTLPSGWVVDFLDVPQSNAFYADVIAIARNGITAGCGGGSYCIAGEVTRAQMAVFLLKSRNGACYSPPPCTGTFSDVSCPSIFADWIEALAAEGITAGCGAGIYCPSSPVRRDQMAAFLLKASNGSNYIPPNCLGRFQDVPCPSLFADWVEQLYAEGVTRGCGTNPLIYCPGASVTRGQMAVFLVKTFNLQ